jgi:hypothetical protein
VGKLKARPGLFGLPDGTVFTPTRQQLEDVCILYAGAAPPALPGLVQHTLLSPQWHRRMTFWPGASTPRQSCFCCFSSIRKILLNFHINPSVPSLP